MASGRLGTFVLVAHIGAAAPALCAGDRPPTVILAPPESEPAIRRALSLLPRRPPRIQVAAPRDVQPASRDRFLRSEAFVSRDVPTVYLTEHSPVLRAAREGSATHVHVLAAIIWHEMAHLEGADEPSAQEREASLWRSFVRDARVDAVGGLRYLKRLVERHEAAPAPAATASLR